MCALVYFENLCVARFRACCWFLVLVSCGVTQAQQDNFHTPPSCWDSPRIYHVGRDNAELAGQIEVGLLQPAIGLGLASKAPPDLIAPNGAYRAWNQAPDTSVAPPWQHRVIVDAEQERWHTLSFVGVAGPVMPAWISEKLLFMRVMWGRVMFEDVIWDVEQNSIVYREVALDGHLAYAQFKQSCQGDCVCSNANPLQALPESRPAEDQAIGLVLLPSIYGAGETGGLIDAANPRAVDVYRNPDANSQVVVRPDQSVHFESEAYSYEAGAAVVYGRSDGWLRVKLRGQPVDSGWIKQNSDRRFLPLNEILPDRLAYLNSAWDGMVYSSLAPTGSAYLSPFFDRESGEPETPVVIYQVQETASGAWVQLAFHLSHPCESGEGGVSEKVWVPAYNSLGQLTTWFWSRGC